MKYLRGGRGQVSSWSDALDNLRSAYGDRRPTYRIYRELFSARQASTEKTDIYVAKARALLARLPSGDLSEKVEVDMVYGLLNKNIRERLTKFRHFLSSFLRRAREIEDSTGPDVAAVVPAPLQRPYAAAPAAVPPPASRKAPRKSLSKSLPPIAAHSPTPPSGSVSATATQSLCDN